MNNSIFAKTAAAAVAAVLAAGTAFAAKRDADKSVYTKYASPRSGTQAEWGTLNCHDPKIFQDDDGMYYVYSTDAAIGGAGQKGLQIRRSADLVNWECLNTSAIQRKWDKAWLKWVEFDRAGASSWAPTVIKQNGLYYMYHGIITDKDRSGDPVAAIALAVSSSVTGPFYPAHEAAAKDPKIKEVFDSLGVSYEQSLLVRYTYYDRSYTSDDESITMYDMFNTGSYDTQNETDSDFTGMAYGFGCIDPEFVTDVSTGKQMVYNVGGTDCYGVTYGSWKGGIALMYVDTVSLKPVDREGNILDVPADSVEGAFGKAIAGGYGAAYEGAQVIYNSSNGWYYCFVSMGSLDWDYRVGVGRSRSPEGPYIDASGRSMMIGPLNGAGEFHKIGGKIIGSHVLKGELSFRSQGGQSILRTQDGKVVFANHTRTNFLPGYFFFLQIHQMFFTEDGWPVLNQNEYYNDYDGKDEALAPLSAEDIAGTYDTILTVRSDRQGDYTFNGDTKPVTGIYLDDAIPTESKEVVLEADGTVKGTYKGTWTLSDNGYSVVIKINGLGDFKGYVLKATDWAKNRSTTRKTVTFTTLECSGKGCGEYFWGNRRDK